MGTFGIWPAFGFSENPYSNETLPGDEIGDALFVGRDVEVGAVQRGVANGGTHPTLEGLAGVGKSSLTAVALYRMFTASLAKGDGTLFIPASRFFQASTDADRLEAEVYREVAQTLISHVDAFRRRRLETPNVGDLDRWLNNAQFTSAGGGGLGFSGNYGATPNDAEGFARSGFAEAVRTELERSFPTSGSGAIVCVLDNLELLQTSADARDALEALRDRIFNLKGLRWVLCGSRGIVSRARSQRLSGVFAAPTIVSPLSDTDSIELIRRRIDLYGVSDAQPPVSPGGFEFLYRALNLNLRDALAYAQQFSDWLYEQYVVPERDLPPSSERDELLEAWLAEQADAAHSQSHLQPRTWQFFEDLCSRGGRCGAGEWADYDFGTQQQFGTTVTNLVNANLVVREVDPENATRHIATVTPLGWLVYFHRNQYTLPNTNP